mmetsp:Transcript_31720/g.36220  ORF Transcript_31720/g.36220 Transcript_31720/m.36220 type:complete len:152 (-) Transcript_31720:706-1161(-)
MLLESNLEKKMTEEHEEYHDALSTPDETKQDMNDFLSSLKDQKNPEPEIKPEPSAKKEEAKTAIDDEFGGENWEGAIDLDDDILKEMGNDDIDLGDLESEISKELAEKENPSAAPPNPLFKLVSEAIIPAHHVAVGNFEKALELLQTQIGL